MSDRLVRRISPPPTTEEVPKPFSKYLEYPNIVLLGDPGAGKTHLFKEFAAAEMANAYLARDFLNLDVSGLTAESTLFIDALDEKRAGRGDQNTVDAIVARLSAVKPKKVRIACRAADWLGETDLAAFQAYFNGKGGCVVVSLELLSSEEQEQILAQKGHRNAKEFLAAAISKGLEELLSNPQNLIMLADVVKQSDWPTSRKELYTKAVNLLLTEHNLTHTRRDSGAYTADELLEAAGAVCAVRLISDIDGISLADANTRENFPAYRSVTLCDRKLVQAALERRIFEAGPLPETVDYTHRTVAEFLAASWLARRISSGLPIGRVRALVGFDGRPASELRGVHAWLAVFAQDSTELLIDADPFGVLAYGDASSMVPRLRKHLLEALARLSQSDPWFRVGNWSTASVSALSAPDMEESFRAVLNSKTAAFTLRSIVLDALVAGSPIPPLRPVLLRILLNSNAPYSERERALHAILQMAGDCQKVLSKAYKKIGVTPNDIRIRAAILAKIYEDGIGPSGVATLLSDTMRMKGDLIGGALWFVSDAVPDSDVADVLNRLGNIVPATKTPHEPRDWRNAFEVGHVIDQLLVRYIRQERDLTGEKLWNFLELRHRCVGTYETGDSQELRGALSGNPLALGQLIDYAIQSLNLRHHAWGFVHHLYEVALHSFDDQWLQNRLLSLLRKHNGDKDPFVYELALTLSFRIEDGSSSFEYLFNYAEGDERLQPIRDRCCFSEIPDWRREEVERRKVRTTQQKSLKAKNRSEFEARKDLISNAADLGWLGFLGKIYWGLFADLDSKARPHDRLISEFGEENAAIALEGFAALIRQRRISSLAEVVDLHTKNRQCTWWYAVLAGLAEYVGEGNSIDSFSDDYFRSVLAIDCLHPVSWHRDNSVGRVEHGWKQTLKKDRPHLLRDAYLALARADLFRNTEHVSGLHELMNLEQLKPDRALNALALLEEFPEISAQIQRHLLPRALGATDHARLRRILDLALGRNSIQFDGVRRGAWLAIGFLIAPNEFKSTILSAAPAAIESAIWNIRDFCGSRHKPDVRRLSIDQLEFLIEVVGGRFRKAGPPSTGWSGDTNPWDAAELVHHMLSALSADTSERAGEALGRLVAAPALQSYLDDVKHARAQQRVRRVDDRFRQPTWKQAVEALGNGRPANIADLHALVISHLNDLNSEIRGRNTDIYKRFWNEDKFNHVVNPKGEESCRDVLVELLQHRLAPHDIRVEPEGHMVTDKRADIVVLAPNIKLVIELKRDYHADVWTAAQEQLDRLYTTDPEALGFGIYGVFWFGPKRTRHVVKPPGGSRRPNTAVEMQRQLISLISLEKRARIEVLVLDVTEPANSASEMRQVAKNKRRAARGRATRSPRHSPRRKSPSKLSKKLRPGRKK